MPRVDIRTVTTVIEIGPHEHRRPLHTGPLLDPARLLFPDKVIPMEQQGQRRMSNRSAANTSLQRPKIVSRATSAPAAATMPSSSITRPLLAPLRAKTESQHSKHRANAPN
jgi:hypothetical protein